MNVGLDKYYKCTFRSLSQSTMMLWEFWGGGRLELKVFALRFARPFLRRLLRCVHTNGISAPLGSLSLDRLMVSVYHPHSGVFPLCTDCPCYVTVFFHLHQFVAAMSIQSTSAVSAFDPVAFHCLTFINRSKDRCVTVTILGSTSPYQADSSNNKSRRSPLSSVVFPLITACFPYRGLQTD